MLTKIIRFPDNDPKVSPAQKETVDVLEEPHPSPFERFLVKAFNMLKIWEMIVSNMTAQDVANCLKVNHGFRMALGQCISSNTKLRQELDAAATVRALNRGTVKSTSVVQISHENKYGFCNEVVSIDGTWFYLQESKDRTGTIRLDSKDKNVVHCYYSYKFMCGFTHAFIVLPTRNPKQFFIRDINNYYGDSLIEKQSRSVKQIAPSKEMKNIIDLGHLLGRNNLTPHFAKYRLYESTENGSRKVFMHIYGHKDVDLFTLNEKELQESPLRVKDLECDEQASSYSPKIYPSTPLPLPQNLTNPFPNFMCPAISRPPLSAISFYTL